MSVVHLALTDKRGIICKNPKRFSIYIQIKKMVNVVLRSFPSVENYWEMFESELNLWMRYEKFKSKYLFADWKFSIICSWISKCQFLASTMGATSGNIAVCGCIETLSKFIWTDGCIGLYHSKYRLHQRCFCKNGLLRALRMRGTEIHSASASTRKISCLLNWIQNLID